MESTESEGLRKKTLLAGGREEMMVSSREKHRCEVASGLGGFWGTRGPWQAITIGPEQLMERN